MFHKFVNFIFPPCCRICAKRIPEITPVHTISTEENINPFSYGLCLQCAPTGNKNQLVVSGTKLSPLPAERNDICSRCGEFTISDNNQNTSVKLCPTCKSTPLILDRLISLWWYREEVENCIKAFKYRPRLTLANFLGDCAALKLNSEGQNWDLLIPIPSSPHILRRRGFSHTALLAKRISKRIRIKTSLFALTSNKKREAQAELPMSKRYANLSNAFEVKSKIVARKNILLLDDVVTTGSTLSLAALALKDAGANSVSAITIARSPNFGIYRIKSRDLK